jgi:hypothetical protein
VIVVVELLDYMGSGLVMWVFVGFLGCVGVNVCEYGFGVVWVM